MLDDITWETLPSELKKVWPPSTPGNNELISSRETFTSASSIYRNILNFLICTRPSVSSFDAG